MTISPSNPGNPSSYHLPAVKTDAWSTTQQQQPSIISPTSQRQQPSCDSRQFSGDVCSRSLPYNGMAFLKWFSNLEKGNNSLIMCMYMYMYVHCMYNVFLYQIGSDTKYYNSLYGI